MKKLLLIPFVAIMLASCQSIDSKIESARKAAEEGDHVKVEKILNDLEKHSDELTTKQKVEIAKIYALDKSKDAMEGLNETIEGIKEIGNSLENALNNLGK